MESIFKTVSFENRDTVAGIYQRWSKGESKVLTKQNQKIVRERIRKVDLCLKSPSTPEHLIEGLAQEVQQLKIMVGE
jgi:hypothetical protein